MVAARVVMPIVVVLVAAAGLAAAQDDPSLAAQYERKMEVFNATLAAATAYTQAFEDLQAYAAIAREAGGVLRPGFGAKLEEFRARLEKAADTRAFKGIGTAATVQEHVAGAVALVSEIDGILKDPNLPPAAKRSLTALRGAGEALSLLGGNVPVLGEGLKAYGDVLKELTRTVHAAAANVEALKGGNLSSAEERALGGLPTATRLYEKAPAWALGLPVVSDVESGATFLRAPDGAWRPVDGDEVARIAAEWKYVRGSAPAPKDVVEYLDSPAERARLAAQAQTRARVELNQRLMADLGVSGMEHRDFIRVKYALETRLEGLGLAMSPRSPAFRRLLGGELTRPGGDDAMLRRMALDAHPDARAYLRWLGLDPDRLTLDELTQRLRQYRTGDYRRFARAQPARAAPDRPRTAPSRAVAPPPPAAPRAREQTEVRILEARAESRSLQLSLRLPEEARAGQAMWATVLVTERGRPASGTIRARVEEGIIGAWRHGAGKPVPLHTGPGCPRVREAELPLADGVVQFSLGPPFSRRFTAGDISVSVAYGALEARRAYRYVPWHLTLDGAPFTIRMLIGRQRLRPGESGFTFTLTQGGVSGHEKFRWTERATSVQEEWRYEGALGADGEATGRAELTRVETSRHEGSVERSTTTGQGRFWLRLVHPRLALFRARGATETVVRRTEADGRTTEARRQDPAGLNQGDDPGVECPAHWAYERVAK